MPLGTLLTAPPPEQYIPPEDQIAPPPPEEYQTPGLDASLSSSPPSDQQSAPVEQAPAEPVYQAPGLDASLAPPPEQAPVAEAGPPVPTQAEAQGGFMGALGGVKDAVTGGHPEEIIPSLGGVKEAAGTLMSAQGGDILPWRRAATNKLAEMAQEDIGYDSPGDYIYHAFADGALGAQPDAWTQFVREDPRYQDAVQNGYTDPGTGTTFAPGNEAAWESFVSDKTAAERAALDLLYDPSTATIAEPFISGLSKAGRIPKAAGTIARGVDDLTALGLNQAVGGVLGVAGKSLKKIGLLAPTKTQAAKTTVEATEEALTQLGPARREGGQVGSTTVENLAPGVFRLGSSDPAFPPITYKTDGRQITSIIDDPTNLANIRPVTSGDNEKLLNLIQRANPEDQAILMRAGGGQLLQPDATVAQPYLKTLQAALPSTATGPLRAAVPPPTSAPELLALRSQLTKAITDGNVTAQQALTLAARNSNLLPPTTPPTPKGVHDAIGAVEAARRGTPLIDPATLTAVSGTLRKNLDAIGLTDIGLSIDRSITNTLSSAPSASIEGQYLNKVITLATDLAGTANEDEMVTRLGDVLNHETIHAVRHMNLFRPVEWRSLSEMARSTKLRGDPTSFLDEVTARYEAAFRAGEIPTQLTPEQLEEEAIAEMYRAHIAGQLVATDVQKGLLEKIVAFFRTMVQTLQGARPGQVLSNLESGVIGGRSRPGTISTMSAARPAMVRRSPIAEARPLGKIPEPVNPPTVARGAGDNPRFLMENISTLAGTKGPGAGGITDEVLQDVFRQVDAQYGNVLSDLMQPGKALENLTLPSAEMLDRSLRLDWRDIGWYEDSAIKFADTLAMDPAEMNMFFNMLAATSVRTEPKYNLDRTISAVAEAVQGKPILTPGTLPGSMAEAIRQFHMSTPKFYNFSSTPKYLLGMIDTVPGPTLDLQFAHALGLPDNSALDGDVYDALAEYMMRITDEINLRIPNSPVPLQTWNIQAGMWVDYRINNPGLKFETGSSYAEYLDDVVGRLKEIGAPLGPGDKIITQTFMKPEVIDAFGQTAKFVTEIPYGLMPLTEASLPSMQQATRLASHMAENGIAPARSRSIDTAVINPLYDGIRKDVMPQLMRSLHGTNFAGRAIQNNLQRVVGGSSETVSAFPLGGGVGGNGRWIAEEQAQKFTATAMAAKFNLDHVDIVSYRQAPEGGGNTFRVFLPDISDEVTPDTITRVSGAIGHGIRGSVLPTGGTEFLIEPPPDGAVDFDRLSQALDQLYPGDVRVEVRDQISTIIRGTPAEYPQVRQDFLNGIDRQESSGIRTEVNRAKERRAALTQFEQNADRVSAKWDADAQAWTDLNKTKAPDWQPGPPRQTGAGASYSVVRFKGYHGSPRTDLTVLSPDPPVRVHRTGAALLGAFVSGDEYTARQYAGLGQHGEYPKGRLYETDVSLEKPYHMQIHELHNLDYPDNMARNDALDLKERLAREGYDGIIAWAGPPRVAADGTVDASDPTKMLEVILFKDVPVYSLKKGQSGVKPTKPGAPVIPGVYKRGSVQEYLGSIIPDVDREVLDVEYTFGGKTEKAWQRFVREQDSAEAMRDLAIRQESGVALSAKETNALDRFTAQLAKEGVPNAKLASWSDEAIDKLAAKRTGRFIEQAQGLRNASGDLIDPNYYKGILGRGLKAYDNFSGFRRTMSLYSTTRGPAYVLMQAIGNAITLAIADPTSLKYYSPIEANRIVQNARGKGPEPYVYQLRDRVGLGRTESLGASRDQLRVGPNPGTKTFFENSTSPVVRGIGKIVANQAFKERADSFDVLIRHTAWRGAFEPGYRTLVSGLPDRAAKTLADFAARSGIPSPITGDVFANAVRGLGPTFTGAQLRKSLVDAAPSGSPIVSRAAERVARDYVNDVRSLDKLSLENVNRIGFSFDETRADAVLSRVFMFHYWLSRASVLYLREAAANPYQLQLWSRAMNAGNKKAEAGIPEWQKNFQEFMSTPAGITGLWNPAYLVGTYLFMREDQEAMPWEDLTKLGQATQTGFVSNLMLNPLLQGAIYVLGAGGSDFNPPDILGTGKWTGDINTWIEKANRDVSTFYATELGNPKVVPNVDSRSLLSWVADQITQRGWENDFFGMAPITSYDPNTSEQVNLSWLIHDQVLTENPELNDGTEESAKAVASMVEEAMANPDSDLYQAAADNLVSLYTSGPGSGRGNTFLDIAGYYGRQVLPFGITTQVTSRREKQIRTNREEKTSLDTEMGYLEDATPEGRALSMGYDEVLSSWDAPSQQIKDISNGIKNGTLEMDAIMIEGKPWTNEELLAIPQQDRDALAKFWLTYPQEQLGGKTGREILDGAYAAEDEALAAHPEVQDYWALGDYVRDYPGGPIAAIEDTAAINSNYRRFLETLPADLTEAQFIDEATSYAAYGALSGTKLSRYDANPLSAGKGQIAGLEGQTLADWRSTQETTDTQYLSKTEKVEQGLETFGKIDTVLRGYDQLWGLAPGTLSTQYAADVAGGGYASDQVYGILKDEGFSDEEIRPRTEEDKAAPVTWYFKWATENGVTPGDDVARYVAEDDRRYYGQRVADINAGIYSDPDPTEETLSEDPTAPLGSDDPYVRPPKESWYSSIGNLLGGTVDAIGSLFGGGTAKTVSPEAYAAPVSTENQSAIDPRMMTTDYTGQSLIDLAQEYIGVDYRHNFPDAKDDPRQTGWDCSSFIHWLADNAGITEEQYHNDPGYVGGGVPVGSHFQWQWAEENDLIVGQSWEGAQPGDAIYFSTDPNRENCDPANYNGCMNNDASHVGLYLGADPDTGRPLMMHAAAPGIGTVYDYLDSYPFPVLGVVRFLPEGSQIS